jgi:hypothetical protein
VNLFLRGASAIRHTCEEGEGQPTYEYVCAEKDYDLHHVQDPEDNPAGIAELGNQINLV